MLLRMVKRKEHDHLAADPEESPSEDSVSELSDSDGVNQPRSTRHSQLN